MAKMRTALLALCCGLILACALAGLTFGQTVTLPAGTLNIIPKFASSGTVNSSLTDNGTTVSTAEQINAGGSNPTAVAGDIAASRNATTGAFLAGTDGNGFLYRSTQTGWSISAGSSISQHVLMMAERGSCAMSATTTCTFVASGSWSGTPLCFTEQTTNLGTLIGSSCAQSGTTVTITAAASTTNTFNALLVGNPN